MPLTEQDALRLELNQGIHGAHCTDCDHLFDAFDTPSPLGDVVMRMSTLRCPRCGTRKHLMLVMPWKYREMVRAAIDVEARKERVRQVADRYIPRG